MFVVQVHEVLEGIDVAEFDRLGRVEAFPVVKGITVVTENGRPVEYFRGVAEG